MSAGEASEGVVGEQKIAIVAALPREIGGLVRGVAGDAALRRVGVHLHVMEKAVVVAAGMGAARVTAAVDAAFRCGDVELVISAGLAGACAPEIGAGEVRSAGVVVDAKTGERFACEGERDGCVLVTSEAIAGVREKARLRASYGAALVDMEAATVARLAMGRGVRFQAVKGVSDAHDFEMESLSRFADARGHFRTGAFAMHTAVRPHRWGAAMRLGRESNRALERMWAELRRRVETAR